MNFIKFFSFLFLGFCSTFCAESYKRDIHTEELPTNFYEQDVDLDLTILDEMENDSEKNNFQAKLQSKRSGRYRPINPENLLVCKTCNKNFPTTACLNFHKVCEHNKKNNCQGMHPGELRKFTCEYCTAKFTTQQSRRRHQRRQWIKN